MAPCTHSTESRWNLARRLPAHSPCLALPTYAARGQQKTVGQTIALSAGVPPALVALPSTRGVRQPPAPPGV